ncbi:unnamed protein product [Prorocentrum cordatum]|uniref:Mannosyltransferase n=1 Tax=Prorocentrum cordatum TaxID=2364126 RepID=A0ABN9UVI6_9DINO|nr:unnamed protein product [Polarella glacialis]
MSLCPHGSHSKAARQLVAARGDEEKAAEAQCRDEKREENGQDCGDSSRGTDLHTQQAARRLPDCGACTRQAVCRSPAVPATSPYRRPSVVAPPTTPPGTPRPPRSRAALLAQPPGRQPTAGLRRGPFRAEHTELVAQPGVWSMPGGPMQLPTALLWQWQPGTPQTSTLEVSSCIHDWTIYEGFTNILLIIITDLRHQHRHQHHQVQDAEASSSASSGPGPRAPRTSGALASSRPRPDLLICDAL